MSIEERGKTALVIRVAMEKATVKIIGQTLRRQLSIPETKGSKELRRLVVQLERRERERKAQPKPRPH